MEPYIIVFFGNFNPITTAHKEMILEALKYLEPDSVRLRTPTNSSIIRS